MRCQVVQVTFIETENGDFVLQKQSLVFCNKQKSVFGGQAIILFSTNRVHTHGWGIRQEIRSHNIRFHHRKKEKTNSVVEKGNDMKKMHRLL